MLLARMVPGSYQTMHQEGYGKKHSWDNSLSFARHFAAEHFASLDRCQRVNTGGVLLISATRLLCLRRASSSPAALFDFFSSLCFLPFEAATILLKCRFALAKAFCSEECNCVLNQQNGLKKFINIAFERALSSSFLFFTASRLSALVIVLGSLFRPS